VKKIICFLLLFVTFCSTIASQETASIAGMIKSGLFGNAEEISEASKNLTDTQRIMLYSDYKKDATVPFVLNLVLGAGIGSFVQGDTGSGLILLATTIICTGAILLSPNIQDEAIGGAVNMMGYAGLISFRIGGSIAPFEYANKYNKKLKETLHYYE